MSTCWLDEAVTAPVLLWVRLRAALVRRASDQTPPAPLPPAGAAAPSASPPVAQADASFRWRELPWTSCPTMSWKTRSPTTMPMRRQRPSRSRRDPPIDKSPLSPNKKYLDPPSLNRDPLLARHTHVWMDVWSPNTHTHTQYDLSKKDQYIVDCTIADTSTTIKYPTQGCMKPFAALPLLVKLQGRLIATSLMLSNTASSMGDKLCHK